MHSASDDLKEMLQMICPIPMISQPTKIAASSTTLIDNIFMSIPEETASGMITCDISDQLPVFITKKNASTQSNPHNQSVFKSYRNTNAANMDKLHEVLSYRLSSLSFS